MRYLEVMLSDEVKLLYSAFQYSLDRSNLDAKNYVMKVVNFYDKFVEDFSNEEYIPENLALPNLHEDFQTEIKLPLEKISYDKR